MIKYNENFKVPYYESDRYGRLSPISLLKYLGELSAIHNALLVDMDEMMSLNYGWMLNRWKVRIDRYPNVGETIKIETWISEIRKFYANREFIIYDEENLEIGRASAVWIFLDLNRKRPIRITDKYYSLDNTLDHRVFEEFYKFQPDIEVDSTTDFNIRRSDIDYNNHVNNTKYLEWMIEAIPEDVYNNYILKEFEIEYKQEIKYPNLILTGIKEVENIGEETTYIHTIVDKESKDPNSLGRSKWEKR